MMTLLRRNLGYKILSIFIGILLYAVAFAQNNPRVSREMLISGDAIEYRNLPSEMIMKTGPQGVPVTVQGQITAIEAFRSQPIKGYIDLSRAVKGRYRAPIHYRPENAQVDISGPTTVDVEINRRTRFPFTVDVLYNNTPPPGFIYDEPTTKPPTVQVTGLDSEVRKVARVVAYLDNGAISNPLTQTVDLVAQTEKQETVDTVEIIPKHVDVTLIPRKAPATKSLVLSAHLSGVPAPGYALTTYMFDPPIINVSGPQTELARMSALTIPVDISGLAQSETRIVTLSLPSGVMRVGQGSNRISVRLEVQRTQVAPPTPASTPTSEPVSTPKAAPSPTPAPSSGPPAGDGTKAVQQP